VREVRHQSNPDRVDHLENDRDCGGRRAHRQGDRAGGGNDDLGIAPDNLEREIGMARGTAFAGIPLDCSGLLVVEGANAGRFDMVELNGD
jgi:hypothetical protein